MNRRERRAAARQTGKTSPRAHAETPAALYEAGLGHMRAARYPDAQLCCQQALTVDSHHAGTLHLMGLLSLQAKQYDQALEWISRAIRHDPLPAYFLSLGTILQSQGRHDEALEAFDKLVQLKFDDAHFWMLRGNSLVNLKRPGDAVVSFQHVLRLDPRHWDAANQCGILLHELGRIEESLSYLNLCDTLRPNHIPTLQMRAALLYNLKRFEEALQVCRQAHALDPDNADICNNVGIALRPSGRDEGALQWFDRALELRPNFRDALHNKAAALTKIRRFDEAFAIYERLKAADPGDVLADLGTAHLHLLLGNFEAGWAGREARWKDPALVRGYPKFRQPMWRGHECLKGKTILIAADEGFGDTIQFVRYVPMVADLGARIILVVQDALQPLLSDLPGVAQCLPMSASHSLPAFDLHCPMMSLPLAFATRLDTIPSFRSYLPALQEARVQTWRNRLGSHDRLRVGLVWAGNPRQGDDHNRSIPLRTLSHILDVDATFVSLQKEPKPDDKAALQELAGIIDLTGYFVDFAETAALVSCLDLVIAVETSVAHLAGALGRPTWTLLSYTPDHRWLLDRDDSPWYPTMRLFRQTQTRDWREVLDRVRSELETQISLFRPGVL